MTAARYIKGDTDPVVVPVLTAQAVAVGDLVGLSSGNAVRAEDETWVSSLAVTQANFVKKFLGTSLQRKDANVARVPANSADNRIRVDPAGTFEFDCASATFAVGDLVGPAKQSGNALESQKVVAVADESLAVGRVAEAGTSVTRVKVKLLSTLVPQARQLSLGTAGSGAGAAAGTNVTAAENGDSLVHQTVLTLAATPVTVANTTGASFGSQKLYDFPEGRILVLGTTAYFSEISWAGQDIGTGGSGDYSLGTTATSDATLDSTDVDLLPSSAMLDPFVAGVGRSNAGTALAAAAQFDGTATPKDAYLNVIIDDADVADAASDTVLFTGTVKITWINLGDF